MPDDPVSQAIMRLTEDLRARCQAKLPSERELAARLGASRAAVRRALGDLEDRGVLRRVQGRAGGAFLHGVDTGPRGPEQVEVLGGGRKVQRSLNRVTSVPDMLRSQGFRTGTRVISAGLEPAAGPAAQFLGLSGVDAVVSMLRIRFADGDSLSLERMYVSAARFPGLLSQSLDGSLYRLFAERGTTVGRVEEAIEAAAAPPQVAALLGVPDGDLLLKLTRRAYDAAGIAFEYSVDLFRADRTRLTVQAGPGARVRSTTTGAGRTPPTRGDGPGPV